MAEENKSEKPDTAPVTASPAQPQKPAESQTGETPTFKDWASI